MINHRRVFSSLLLIFFSAFPVLSMDERGVSLSLKADAQNVYVNAQLIVTIELKTALPLRNGNISKPEIKDAIVESLVEDDQREVSQNGTTVQVFRRSYAVFSNKAGTLRIPAVTFEGVVSTESNGFFPGFFSQGKRITVRSNALSITIKPVPDSYPKDEPFLPLTRLEIVDAFDEPDPKFDVNKATTRRFEIRAQGNLTSAITPIAIPRVKNMQIYAEAGEKSQSASENGISAQISLSHVYLPTEPGNIHVPEQKIYWWDTRSDQLRSTLIKALDIVVEGKATPAPELVPPALETEPEKEPEKKSTAPQKVAPTKSNLLWLVLALLFLVLWLLTLVLFIITLRKYRHLERVKKESESLSRYKELWQKVKNGCEEQDGKKTLASLNAYYRALLQEEVAKDAAREVGACLLSLEDGLYRHPNEEHVREVLKRLKKIIEPLKDPNDIKPPLAPLYPI